MLFKDLNVGMKASITKSFSAEDVECFARLSTDLNPLHMDEEAAKASIFKKRVVHGILVSSLFSAVLGTKLPGNNAIYLGQDLKFLAPVFLNDEITAEVEIINIRTDKQIVQLSTMAYNQNKQLVISGTATILMRDLT